MSAQPETISDIVGLWLGYCVSPVLAAGTLIRRARVFHPGGTVYHGVVKPHPNVKSPYFELAKNLSGGAIVRFSSSAWKNESILPDALGFSIRFRVGKPPHINIEEGAQDLILVTSPGLELLPVYLFTTNQHDFLANTFYGAAPYKVADQSRSLIRVVPSAVNTTGKTREEKLANAVAQGIAVLQLEVATKDVPDRWHPVVEVRLDHAYEPKRPITFSPFHAGLGIQPQGFINYLREGPYVFSQFIRNRAASAVDAENEVAVEESPKTAKTKPTKKT
ncbi:MAG TPA: hypothetical protein VM553_04175, partial [Dongiaceae bacterium]|nr:hypothetical protein [Dongiaceae bacterium]